MRSLHRRCRRKPVAALVNPFVAEPLERRVLFALPDYVPTNVTRSLSSVVAGGSLSIGLTMQNNGGAASVTTNTRLRLNQSATTTGPGDVSLGDISTPAIGASSSTALSKTVSIPSGTAAGTYYVWAVADNTSAISQSNVANDYAHSPSFSVTVVAPLPDYVPTNVTRNLSSVAAGGTLGITLTMQNNGGAAGLTTNTRLRLNQSSSTTTPSDVSLGDVSTAAIGGGSSANLTKTVTIPSGTAAGTYYVWAVADNNSQLNQSSTNNDYAHSPSFVVTVTAPLPDYVPTNVTRDLGTVAAGGTLNVGLTMLNNGGATGTQTNTRLRLNQSSSTTSSSDVSLGDIVTGGIGAGGSASLSKTVTIPSGTAAGTYYVWAVADNNSALSQTNTANDFAHSPAFSITVNAFKPDYVPSNVTQSLGSVAAGGTLDVSLVMRNNGAGTAIQTNTRLRLNQSSTGTGPTDTSLGDIVTAGIAANSSASLSKVVLIPANTSPGTYYVWVVADNNGALVQSDESNDFAHSASFTVTAGGGTPPTTAAFLRFPLSNYSPYGNHLITTVFDHSSGGTVITDMPDSAEYAEDDSVLAFNGEEGRRAFGWDGSSSPGYKNAAHTAFSLGGDYAYSQPQYLNYDGHPGIDFAVPINTDVVAAAGGVVIERDYRSDLGNYIKIDHQNGYYTIYGHLNSFVVALNATVFAGQHIAESGNSGEATTGAHLHFQVRRGNNAATRVNVDPYGYLGQNVLWLTAPPTTNNRIYGIDLSANQNPAGIDWSGVAQDSLNLRFVFVRATLGDGYYSGFGTLQNRIDSKAAAHMQGAASANLIRGAYHLGAPDTDQGSLVDDAKAEAAFFLSQQGAASYLQGGFLRPVLDIERNSNASSTYTKAELSLWVNTWCSEVSATLHVRPFIYTDSNFARLYLDSSVPEHADFWVANWTVQNPQTASPVGITPWSEWKIWQYYGDPDGTAPANVRGIPTAVDLNVFNGDVAALNQYLIGGGGAPPAWMTASADAFYTLVNDSLKVDTGTVTFAGSAFSTPVTLDVDVRAGASLLLENSAQIHSLNLAGGTARFSTSSGANKLATSANLIVLDSLTISNGGTLDLGDHAMIVRSGGLPGVQSLIAAGFNHGHWNGTGGIVSSAAAADPTHGTAIGVAGNASLNKTSFAGVTGLTSSDVFVKYTYSGDANLDGQVDIGDLGLFAGAWQQLSGKTWFDGDFNFDGAVDIGDLGLLAGNWQRGVGNPL